MNEIKEHQDPNDDIDDFAKYTLINNHELLNELGSSASKLKESKLKTSIMFNQS